MGILNVTPDSFHDGGRFNTVEKALDHALLMLDEGASIIDVGGNSTRPGSKPIAVEEEIERTIPVIQAIMNARPDAVISIDTFNSVTAKAAVNSGAILVNDISAGSMDPEMFRTIAELQIPYVLMHMQGTPEVMQQNPKYDDVIGDVVRFFSHKLAALKELGVKDIILDPGFGFGKSLEHNYDLLNHLDDLKIFEHPILIGISRKSMVSKVAGISDGEKKSGTTTLNTLGMLSSADIIRVHDVKEAMASIKTLQTLRRADYP